MDRPIGRGGMGTVFLAQDLKHHRPVAIKVLHPELAGVLGSDRFLREIEIAASLTHPHILPLHDSGAADGLLFYVMPYVEGESLRHRLQREKQLVVDDAVALAREVGDALSYAHGQGIVHRDIKPENILLEAGHAVVTDFGVARAIDAAAGERFTEPGLAIGTPAYMSPEQAAGQAGLDGRSDLYALGCLLYEMLAGDPPFTGSTPQAIVARQMTDPPPSLRVVRSSVPVALEAAIEKALAKVPADRFGTVSQFTAAVAKATGGVAPARSTRWRRITLTALGLVIFAGGFLLTRTVPGKLRPSDPAAITSPPSSIAVLYFDDLSEGRRLDHLAAGLTEDLIDQLAAVSALRVISPDGVRPYRGKDFPPDSVGRVLRVGTLVTGSVSQAADRLRVSVRLADAGTGVQLFGQSFERPIGDVLTLRDQVTEEVARQLRTRLGETIQLRERRAATTVGRAWEVVHRAERLREQIGGLPVQDSAGARTLFKEADSLLMLAEELDPRWTEPTVLRGWLAYDQAAWGPGPSGGGSAASWIREGIRHAERAMRKSPGSPEALELRGTLLYRGWAFAGLAGALDTSMRLGQAESDLRTAAEAPGRNRARAWSMLTVVLRFSGKVAEANVAAQRAYEADAYLRNANEIVEILFHTSLGLKRYQEAAQWCALGQRTFPEDWAFLMCQLSLLAWAPPVTPDADKAWEILSNLETLASPDHLSWLRPQVTMMVAAVLAAAGLPDSAERVIIRARAAAPADPQLPYYEALARVRLGQAAAAAELLEGFLRRSPNFQRFLQSEAAFRDLWDDPRLTALVVPGT